MLRTCELREPRVGDLADEEVLEAVRRLARDRRAGLTEHELPLVEILEQRLDVLEVGERCSSAPFQNTLPIDRAAGGRSCRRGRWSMRAAISACSVSGIRLRDRFRRRSRRASGSSPRRTAGCPPHAREAPGGSGTGARPRRPRAGRAASRRASSLSSSDSGSSSIAVERTRPPPQPGPLLQKLGPRETDDEQRRANPVREMLDQLEQRLLRPVDVLEEQNERLRHPRASP